MSFEIVLFVHLHIKCITTHEVYGTKTVSNEIFIPILSLHILVYAIRCKIRIIKKGKNRIRNASSMKRVNKFN